MKSKEEILESGILEQYVLGLTDDDESRLVKEYIFKFPELKDHLDTIERAMEVIAQKHAIVPPEDLREATLKKIKAKDSISLKTVPGIWRWIAGAAASVCLITLYYGWNVRNQINEISYEVNDLQQKLEISNLDCALIKEDIDLKNRLLEFYMNDNVNPVHLIGNTQLPGADLVVFWNTDEEEAHLKINTMVAPPENHIYQIWADVDGEMISLGTFSNVSEIIDIKYLDEAESLNVTIESGAGSDHPNVNRLIMSSKV